MYALRMKRERKNNPLKVMSFFLMLFSWFYFRGDKLPEKKCKILFCILPLKIQLSDTSLAFA